MVELSKKGGGRQVCELQRARDQKADEEGRRASWPLEAAGIES